MLINTFNTHQSEISSSVEFELDDFEQISDTKYIDKTSVRMKRVKNIRGLFGNASYKVDLDNSVLVKITAMKKNEQTGEFEAYPFSLPNIGFCRFVTEFMGEKAYYEISSTTDFPEKFQCPMKKVRIFYLICF
jgi:hypothetical protein